MVRNRSGPQFCRFHAYIRLAVWSHPPAAEAHGVPWICLQSNRGSPAGTEHYILIIGHFLTERERYALNGEVGVHGMNTCEPESKNKTSN